MIASLPVVFSLDCPEGIVDYAALAEAQQTCPDVADLLKNPRMAIQKMNLQGSQLLCDVSLGKARPFVPSGHIGLIFNSIHGLAHPGFKTTVKLIKSRFVWTAMSASIKKLFLNCQECAKAKIH